MPESYPSELDETFANMPGQAGGSGNEWKARVSETADKAKDKAQEVGRNVQAKIDRSRVPAAQTLQSAASALHEKADGLPGGETVAGVVHKTADTMQATAEYVRKHDMQDMMSDVEVFVRKHPAQSLLAAAAVGFLIGRNVRRDE